LGPSLGPLVATTDRSSSLPRSSLLFPPLFVSAVTRSRPTMSADREEVVHGALFRTPRPSPLNPQHPPFWIQPLVKGRKLRHWNGWAQATTPPCSASSPFIFLLGFFPPNFSTFKKSKKNIFALQFQISDPLHSSALPSGVPGKDRKIAEVGPQDRRGHASGRAGRRRGSGARARRAPQAPEPHRGPPCVRPVPCRLLFKRQWVL